MSCFSSCSCGCLSESLGFDITIERETKFAWRLRDICHSNVGWYTDKTICDEHLLREWISQDAFGVYVLWHKDDYCEVHDMFHMKALYVGKGWIGPRLLSHWTKKDFSQEMLVYWTFILVPNRQAKYCEQLLLDLYRPPLNRAELSGALSLCAHFTQEEVD